MITHPLVVLSCFSAIFFTWVILATLPDRDPAKSRESIHQLPPIRMKMRVPTPPVNSAFLNHAASRDMLPEPLPPSLK